jgi:hypothetical protein
MKFRCEDLAQPGVVLIPHGSPAFQPLCADIRKHLEAPPPGSPPAFAGETPDLPDEDDPASAILWNRSGKPICAFTLIWKNEKIGDSTLILGVGHYPSLLHPFGLTEDRSAFQTYWQTILPQSKRYLDRVLGTNADVRPPAPDEQWSGGVMRWGGGGRERHQDDRADTVTLTLDAAFFSTGECAEPDTRQLWDRVIAATEVHQEVAATARRGVEEAFDAGQILADVEQIIGDAGHPPPPPGPPGWAVEPSLFRERERWSLAGRISYMRTHFGDDKTVSILLDWADVVIPQYRRA